MKSIIAATTLLTLATSTLAAPSTLRYSKRQSTEPSQQNVVDAINSWNIDVDNVNAFLDMTPALTTDYMNAASLALNFASDEPFELMTLASINGLADDATSAINNLMEVFGNVPTALMAIVTDVQSGDLDDINTQIQVIGGTRCCNVLPDLDILWTAAADDEGVSNLVNLVVPRPAQCTDGSIQC